jgi:hypothetical protein
MAISVVLDSNAVDHMVDFPDLSGRVVAAVHSGRVRLPYTHVSIDEIARIPDSKAQRRADILSWLTTFCVPVPTGGFVLDVSRLDIARLPDASGVIPYLQSDQGDHTLDALIGATALYEGACLLTYDKRLISRASSNGIEALTWDALLEKAEDA